jgi:hypothetical protein
MINRFFRILLLVFFLLCFMTGCTRNFNYYEDKLYSEQIVMGTKPSETLSNNNILTREKALQKALAIFDKGLNIKIDRTQFSESIKISRDNRSGNLQWYISWQKFTSKVFYNVVFDASSNEVLEITCTDSRLFKDDSFVVIPQEEINNIINPLLKELNIDPESYSIKPLVKTADISKGYIAIYLLSTKDGSSNYSITINSASKVVTKFAALNENSKRIQEKDAYEKNSGS